MTEHGLVISRPKSRVLQSQPGFSGLVSELSSEELVPSRDLVGLFQTLSPIACTEPVQRVHLRFPTLRLHLTALRGQVVTSKRHEHSKAQRRLRWDWRRPYSSVQSYSDRAGGLGSQSHCDGHKDGYRD